MKKRYKNYSLISDTKRLQVITNSVNGFGYKAGFMIFTDKNKHNHECKRLIEQTFYFSES